MYYRQQLLYLLLFHLFLGKLMAQTDLPGEYQLSPLPEIAAGIQLKPDSSFEFYFIYGALDRFGKGTWTLEGNEVVLKGNAGEHPPFALLHTAPGTADGIRIRIEDKNEFLRSAIYAMVDLDTQAGFAKTNNRGEVYLQYTTADSIFLVSELFPEKIFRYRLPDNGHRELVFRFAPDALDVFLTGIRLRIEGKTLVGPIPLLKPGDYRFNRK
jgi:hypothetical protein